MDLAIVGLDVLSISLGMALKGAAPSIAIVGHDPDPERVALAKKANAIDRSHWNLIAACERADMIILNIPLDTIEKTLVALRQDLKEQAIVIDLAPVKRPVLQWAKSILPATVQYVGGHILTSQATGAGVLPSPSLLKGATFYIVAPEGTTGFAVDAVTNLATAVGATPQYIDSLEHDGLVAATVLLPRVVAAALMKAISADAGWVDRRLACGSELRGLAPALPEIASAEAEAILADADSLLPWIDRLVAALNEMRQAVAVGEREIVRAELAAAIERYGQCVRPTPDDDQGVALHKDKGRWLRDMFLGRMSWRKPH